MKRPSVYFWLIPTILLVLVDEWLKNINLHRLPSEGSLVDPRIVDFAIHKNWGIAFDIPFKLEFVVIISIIIGIVLAKVAYKNFRRHPDIAFASLMIIIGALGNLFDRIYYGFTVDYILILGRSAINLSDLVIILGVVLLLLASRREKRRR
jgi:signal peptidase II